MTTQLVRQHLFGCGTHSKLAVVDPHGGGRFVSVWWPRERLVSAARRWISDAQQPLGLVVDLQRRVID